MDKVFNYVDSAKELIPFALTVIVGANMTGYVLNKLLNLIGGKTNG